MGDSALRLRIVSSEDDPESPAGPARTASRRAAVGDPPRARGAARRRPPWASRVASARRRSRSRSRPSSRPGPGSARSTATSRPSGSSSSTRPGSRARSASASGSTPAALSAAQAPPDLARPVGRRPSSRRRPAGTSTSSRCRPIRSSPSATGSSPAAGPRSASLEADALLDGAERAGYHLVVVDLGSVLEEGHRQLIDQADVVLGVVRPTLESLPDVFRLATVLRAQGMGRKLALVANAADDDTEIGRLAREAEVPARRADQPRSRRSRSPADRGEPAWSIDRRLAQASSARSPRAAWPLLGEGRARTPRRRSLLRSVRSIAPAPRGPVSHERRARGRAARRPAVGRDPRHGPPDARRAPRARGPQPVRRATPERDALLRRTIGAILADPELDLDPDPALVAAVEAAVCGLGPLQPLVDDPEIGDILVNGPDEIFVERSGRLEPTGDHARLARASVIEIAERIAALAGRELSVAHPIVDARMPDGSRVNAVIPPVGGPYLSIRKFNRLRLDLAPGGRHGRNWVADGRSAPRRWPSFLARLVRARANLLVAGETGAGKTTFLRSLTDLFDPTERIGRRRGHGRARPREPRPLQPRDAPPPRPRRRARPRPACSTSATSWRTPCGCGPTG